MADSTTPKRVTRGSSAIIEAERRNKIASDPMKEITFFVKHQPILSPHISSYTNTDIISNLKEKLSPEQYKLFGTTSFGGFLGLKHCEVQHQLFRFFYIIDCQSDNMTNGTPDSSSTPAISRTVFHEDDYTHPCHPLYVHPSDVLGTSLVSTPFDGTGYGSCRRNILVALSIRNKLDFINGNSQKPSPSSPLARQWQRCNDLVISWLVNSLSKEISRSVEYSEFARQIWNELEERYGKADGLWDEIASISTGRTRVCSCGAKSAEDEEQRAYQFLMGLNDTYVQTRSNILMMKPLPSVGAVYSILLSDETQSNVSAATQFPSTSASFNVGVSRQSYPSKVNFESSKPNVTCKYCKKPGHTIEKCYKVHGYPPNFKFTKTPNIRKTAAHVELTNHPESGTGDIPAEHGTLPQSEDMSAIPGLTKDQYSQLMMLLQQSHLSSSPSTSSLMGSANFAVWIIDSGASDHMTSTKSLLFNVQTLPVPYLVSLPNGYKVKVTNIGSLALLPDLILHNVLYVPSFQYNLISVYKLLSHSDDMVQFTKAACTLHGPSVRKPVVLRKLDNGLYKLFQSIIAPNPDFFSSNHSALSNVSVSNSSVHASVVDECSPVNTISAVDNMNKDEVMSYCQSDNALELGPTASGSIFFSEKGIQHQTSCPHTPQQNGVVERKHRHLLETARALLFQSHLPIRFWGDCVLTATYLINRFPSPLLNHKSPYELLYGSVPSYSHLKAFGCLCYSTVTKLHKDKFSHRSIPCVFVGYPFAKKGYKLYNHISKTCFISRDVIFLEHIFPFFKASDQPSHIFSSPLSTCFDTECSLPPPPTSSSTPPPSSSSIDPPSPILHPAPTPTSSPIPSPPGSNTSFPPDPSPVDHSIPLSSSTLPTLRRSSRPHNPPSYLNSYAANIPEWQDAMRKEFEALEANGTWEIVEQPHGKKPIGCKWVYKVKYKADGSIERYKARLVVRGDTQVEGVDFHETFFPVVFMKLPPGLSVPASTSSPSLVCKLQKSLYELRNFCPEEFSHDQFKIKDLGLLNYFLGIEVLYTPSGVLLHQRKFIHNLLDEFHSLECTAVTCPLELNVKLKAKEGELLPKPEEYRSLIGKLNFLTHTRPDLSFAVQHLSQFMQQPCIPHMKAALHLLRYLKGSADFGIFYNNDPAMSLQVFCDSDWASCPDSRSSVTGFCIFLGGSLVGWKSKKQPVVSLSSAEAEYRAMSKAVAELTWLSRLLSDFGVILSSPVPVFCDSQAALHIAKNPVFQRGQST
ncbi:PREDICTED: uncharacterized protein LOC109234787 [Nicotiana attenuata]|uniref:uncharacterized protein LOC109234787 n=1 Tax=Nicotiana attenuata TaxID=49451 RepID=UPI000905675D|nr:PREDICTED: uncharacterized protein LOC109234787 [Nicotiana attenuata]